MKQHLKGLFALVLSVFTLVACQPKTNQTSQGLKIVTSFYPIYAMTKEVSGDLNDVRMIQSGAGIHGFEPSVADVQAIYDADAFIYHSWDPGELGWPFGPKSGLLRSGGG